MSMAVELSLSREKPRSSHACDYEMLALLVVLDGNLFKPTLSLGW